jgi:hypothetical protein
MSETEDRWYVNVGSDDVRMMTLDELVDAFEKGVITKNTLVVEVGGNEWQPLKDVADLGDEDPVPAAAPVRAAAPAQLPKPPVQASWPPQAVSRESAWPPAAAWSSVAPVAQRNSAPVSMAPNSTIPVVQDLDLDLPAQSFKTGKKNLAIFAVLAVALAGGAGFAISKSGSGPATSPVPVPAAAPKLPDPTPTPYSNPDKVTETTPAPTEAKEPEGRLSDEQKKALLSQDKERDEKKKSRASAPRSGGGSAAPRDKGGSVFKANGNANDPLNPTL